VFSRTTIRSTPLNADLTPASERTGPQVRVEVEVLPERDVDAPVADADARLERSLERDLVLLDRGEQRVGDRVVARDDGRLAAELLVPLDLGAGALEHRAHRSP
jgi:hypothetical protein